MKKDLLSPVVKNRALNIRQRYSLGGKIEIAKQRIREWFESWGGRVYVSFSGGKDSTVLLHIARLLYPNILAVFVDTGLEYPEIREFVKCTDNTTWIRPSMPFNKVLQKYGYPIVSKEQAQYIHQYRSAKSEKTKNTRWNGNSYGRGKISEKWKYLVDAPFGISEKCCDIMKKKPILKFEKETNLHPILGTMASESSKRVQEYNLYGCNSFDTKRPISKPLSIWNDNDIWGYIKHFKVPYSDIYNKGYKRTGCMFCLFGHHIALKEGDDRLSRMKETHPVQYKYCMEKLGIKDVLEWYPKKL